MATLTLSVDPQVLRQARIRALKRGESVNKYLSEQLERYAGLEADDVVSDLLSIAREHPATSASGPAAGQRGWQREDLYDV
ncbi:hypothetical protein [Actinomyces faecalis]|uniref:hypothetical protein n=1 Tax=Actinomyces faecalis TaxID=2722820 RepID=UPI001555DE2D|nr:hypothetical protein [Actinomyces faecalis]